MVAAPPSPALRALVRHQLRRSWGASLALVVVAGLLAAVPMALLSASRYGNRAFDRFVAFADPPDFVVNICPPGVDPAVEGVDACTVGVDLTDEVRRISSLDGVRSARTGGFVYAVGGASDDPADWGPPVPGHASAGPRIAAGRPIIVDGRIAEPGAPDEIMLTEAAAAQHGVGVGDPFHLAAPASDDPVRSEVVGIVRTVDDLLPVENPTGPAFHARDGWIGANAERVVVFAAVLVDAAPARADDVAAALREEFDGQFVNVEPFLAEDQQRISHQALDFEANALAAVAAAGALAVGAIVAQVVARRSRAELEQASTLRALGATRRFLAGTVVLRWAPVAAGAFLVAVGTSAAAATLGPFGVARRAPWSGALRIDGWSVAACAVLLPVCVLAPALTAVRRPPAPSPGRPVTLGPEAVSRVASTFLRQALRRRSAASMATAVVAGGLALTCLLGVVTVTESLDRVVADPARFGAPYDALVTAGLSSGPDDLPRVPGVEGATVLLGADLDIGGDRVWTQAGRPVEGLPPVPPVVFDGVAPVADDEIALAPVTFRDVGLAIGDEIEVPSVEGGSVAFRIVGVAPVADGYEHNVGIGAWLTEEGLARVDPLGVNNDGGIAVRVDPTRRSEALAALKEAFPGSLVPFPVPSTLVNARRIDDLPAYLAIGGAVVAGASFVHALLLTARRRRRDLALLRVFGFRRSQSFAVVTSLALALASLAAVLGTFGGVVAGVWGWKVLSDAYGVAPSPSWPIAAMVAAPVGMVVVALLASLWPAWRASRVPIAHTLRTD